MPKYKTLLFDADDTLLDFHAAERNAIYDTLTGLGIPCPDSTIQTYSAINLSLWKALERKEIEKERLRVRRFELLCVELSLDVPPEVISVAYTDNLAKNAQLIDGAIDVCKNLSKICRLYIITNGLKNVQTPRMDASGLLPYIEGSFISEDIGVEKPDVRYFERVSSLIPNFKKSETLVIGDSLTSDMAGGIAFGLDTCFYNPKNKPIPENMNITYVISSLKELYAIINGNE